MAQQAMIPPAIRGMVQSSQPWEILSKIAPIQVTVNLDGNYVKTYIDQALGAQLAGLFG